MRQYNNSALGFQISYPENWEVVPAPWVKQFNSRAKHTSEKLAEFLEKSRAPFLILHNPNVAAGLAVPAVKCQVFNLSAISQAGGLENLVGSAISALKQAFADAEIREYAPECIVAGVVGSRLVATMSVSNEEAVWFHGLTEMLFLPARRYLFLVSLTGTADGDHRPSEDFKRIIRSIRI